MAGVGADSAEAEAAEALGVLVEAPRVVEGLEAVGDG
jgi:hypothetical protein